jgi:predicted PurR-regulated permease PerM
MNSPSTPAQDWASRVLWLLGRLAVIAFALYLLWQLEHVVTLMFVAGAIAYLLAPVVDLFCRVRPRGTSPVFWRGVMSLVVLLGFIALVGLGVRAFLTPFVAETRKFVQNSDAYQQKAQSAFEGLQEDYKAWYNGLPEGSRKWVDQQLSALQESTAGITKSLQTGATDLARQTGRWLNFLVELFLLPVIVFYLIMDSRHLKRETLTLIPRRYLRVTMKTIAETNRVMQAYIIGQLILCTIAGVAIWIGLRWFGVSYALTLALFAGLARAIPVIGSIVAAVPIVIMTLITTDAGITVQMIIFITILFLIEHKMIMPKVIGDRVDLHPVLVIIVLLVSGKFFGLMGMFFGVPIAVIVRNVARSIQTERRRPVHISKITLQSSHKEVAAGKGGPS